MPTVPPDLLAEIPAPPGPADTESEAAAALRQAGSEAPASVPQEPGTDPAGATGQETAAVVPQAGDATPDPVPEVPDPVSEVPDPEPTGPEDPEAVATTDAEVSPAEANPPESRWTRPSFVSITGGSFGFQIGVQSTDLVLVFVNRGAANRLLERKFTMGGDASVSAGPVGRTVEELDTDVKLQTEIYAYSRSRGLFAGVSLEGANLATDLEANENAYGEPLGPEELLLDDSGRLPAELATFVQALVAMAAG